MENMSSSIEPVPLVPRTANLLACKQWWRVCFLYGDQQKYYRQVYSKAAAQRLALSTGGTLATGFPPDNSNDNDIDNDNENETHSGKDSGCSGSMQTADYDTVAGDFIETQLDDADANETITTTVTSITATTLADEINSTDIDKTHNQELNKLTAKKKKKQKAKEGDEQAPPVPLFPSKYQNTNVTAVESPATNSLFSTTSRGKKLLRSLRVHVGKGGEKSAKARHKAALNSADPKSEATKGNAKVTVLDDPFLFGIDADHLGDLVRGKQYAPNTTEHISQYYNTYLEQEQFALDAHNGAHLAFSQHLSTAPSTPVQYGSMTHEPDAEPKPALPPKKKKQSNYEALSGLVSGSLVDGGSSELQLNESDLQFLNLNMRNRSLPRSMKPFKDVPTDISFTFTEGDAAVASPPRPAPLQKSATCERDMNLGAHLKGEECDE